MYCWIRSRRRVSESDEWTCVMETFYWAVLFLIESFLRVINRPLSEHFVRFYTQWYIEITHIFSGKFLLKNSKSDPLSCPPPFPRDFQKRQPTRQSAKSILINLSNLGAYISLADLVWTAMKKGRGSIPFNVKTKKNKNQYWTLNRASDFKLRY